MTKRLLILLFTFSVLVIGVRNYTSFAYDDKTTHPALTDEIVDFYNLSSPDKKLTSQQKEWIVEGAIMEDDPPRWINHFYDPVYGSEWTGERAGSFSSSTMRSLATAGLLTADPLPATEWIHDRQAQRRYLLYQGDRTWEKALEYYVEGNEKESYRTLGHILHLLEDQSVPDHTRNDTHAHELESFTGDYGSPYEEYLKKYDRQKLKELNIATNLKRGGLVPTQKSSIEEYLKSLATYSNSYFFSKDTINDPEYQYPKITREDNNFGYGRDEKQGEFILAKIKSKEGEKFNFQSAYVIEVTDENILDAYFSRLSRQVVLHGAGVIDLFQKQAEEARKDKRDLSYSGPIFDIPMVSVTAGAIKVFSAAASTYNAIAGAVDNFRSGDSNIASSQSASLIGAVTAESSSVNVNVDDIYLVPTNFVPVEQEVVGGGENGARPQAAPLAVQSSPSQAPSPALLTPAPIIIPVAGRPQVLASNSSGSSPTQPASSLDSALLPESATSTNDQIGDQSAAQATVTTDTAAPVITILGEDPITLYTGDRYTDASATALDETDGSRPVSSLSNVNIFIAGTYAVTYTANDLSGNTATATRTVNVLDAVSAPEFSDLNLNTIPDSEEENVIVSGAASLSAGEYRFNNLTVTASSTLTLMSDLAASTTFKGAKITARNITVDGGSSISADMQGYDQNISGPGTAIYPGGASYGGAGYSNTEDSTYGSATAPIDLGSSGPSVCCSVNKNGGGAMRLVVAETFTNNGTVSADGSPSTSGGSIYVTANILAGAGNFHANGGSGSSYYNTGAGGGGRIAIYYQSSSYEGRAEALGGLHYNGWSASWRVGSGTAGLFDMTNNDFSAHAPWRFQASDGPFDFNRITIEGGASVSIEDGVNITARELAIRDGSTLSVSGAATLVVPVLAVDESSTLTLARGEALTMDTFSVMGTSTILATQGIPLALSARDITIGSGSILSAEGKGYAPGEGPGASLLDPQGGASHGGVGYRNTATSTYGSPFAPTDMGSGGNGHPSSAYGGGAIKLTANNITVNGTISAGGGVTASGGSIYLIADTFAGNGVLSANGGISYWPNIVFFPGGGGRIAVDTLHNSFTGSLQVNGGCVSLDSWTMTCAEDGTAVYGMSITNFEFTSLTSPVTGVIDECAHTISLTVPYGTDVTALAPAITISRGATVTPASGEAQDFTNLVTYAVASATTATSTYAVTVTVESPPPDITPPSIINYTLNGVADTITLDPTLTPLTLVLNANEDVDWVSIKIENENDAGVYKIFYSSTGCVDGTAVCTKIWDGATSGGDLVGGTYRIKVHIKDTAQNIYQDYLSPYVITVSP